MQPASYILVPWRVRVPTLACNEPPLIANRFSAPFLLEVVIVSWVRWAKRAEGPLKYVGKIVRGKYELDSSRGYVFRTRARALQVRNQATSIHLLAIRLVSSVNCARVYILVSVGNSSHEQSRGRCISKFSYF